MEYVPWSLLDEAPFFEAAVWARGDQHNGHSVHCCALLQLNGHSPMFITDEKVEQKGGCCHTKE